jgi:pimeloyl-ACP methyl ester carboxylesterase
MPHARVAGIDIYYEWHGPASGPVLVLNNGILMTTASWGPQLAAFGRAYRVLLYDMRQQGLSSHPDAPVSMWRHADDLALLLDAVGVESAHVLGISYGGEVSQAFALAHPARVRSLVLADTVSEVGPELRATVEAWRRVAATADPDAFFAMTVPWNFSPGFIARNAALLATARSRYETLDFPAVVRLCDAFQGVEFTSRLKALSVPACVLVGEADLLKGRDYAERIAAAIPGAEFHVIPGAGHASCWERPAEFNSIVLGFLAKQG